MTRPPIIENIHNITKSSKSTTTRCCCEVSRPDSLIVIIGNEKGIVGRSTNGKVVGKAEIPGGTTCILSLGTTVWLGSGEGVVGRYLVNDDGITEVKKNKAHKGAVTCICTDGERSVLSSSESGDVLEWDADFVDKPPKEVLPPSASPITALAYSLNTLLLGSHSGHLKVIDTHTSQITTWTGHTSSVTCISVVLLEQIWSADNAGDVLIRCFSSGEVLKTLSLPVPVTSITLVGDKVWLWSSDRSLTLVSPLTFAASYPEPDFKKKSGTGIPVGVVQVAQADVRRVWTPSTDGSIGVWDVTSFGVGDVLKRTAEDGATFKRKAERLLGAAETLQEMAPLEEELKEERKRVAELEDTVKGLVAHCTQLQESVYEHEKANSGAQNIESLKAELAGCYEHTAVIETDCAHLSAELQESRQQVDSLRDEVATLRSEAAGDRAKYEAETAEFRRRLESVSSKEVECDRENTTLRKRVKFLEGIEEQAIEAQEIIEDIHKSYCSVKSASHCATETAHRASILSEESASRLRFVQETSSTATEYLQEELRCLTLVDTTLRHRLNETHLALQNANKRSG